MSLPRVLNMALTRFSSVASKESTRIRPLNKTSFLDGEDLIYQLPSSSSVIDLLSMALYCRVDFNGTGSATVNYDLGKLFSRMTVSAGGTTIYTNNDLSTTVHLRNLIAMPNYSTLASQTVYEKITGLAVSDGVKRPCVWPDIGTYVFGSKTMRFLPVSAFPGPIEVRLTPAVNSRIGALPSTLIASIGDTWLQFSKYGFTDNMWDNAIAQRLSQGPLQISYENHQVFAGPAHNGDCSFTFNIAAQSLDYVIGFQKQKTLTNANFFDLPSGAQGSNAGNPTFQFMVNSTPVSSFPLDLVGSYISTMEALDGLGNNPLIDPAWENYTQYIGDRYLTMHRFCMPTMGSEEARTLVSGLNTYGSQAGLSFEIRNATGDGGAQAFVLCIMTSTIELSAGRTIAVVM